MADIVTMAQEELKARGAAEAAALAAKAVEGSADGTELIDHEEMVPTWRQRDYSSVSVGTPYKWPPPLESRGWCFLQRAPYRSTSPFHRRI